MFGRSCMTRIRAGTDSSVSELFLSSRFFNVLLARTAAHRSLTHASVKPVISTLQKKSKKKELNKLHTKIYWQKKRCSLISAELTRGPPADNLGVQQHPRDIWPLHRPLHVDLHSKTWVEKSRYSAVSLVPWRLVGSIRIVSSWDRRKMYLFYILGQVMLNFWGIQ